MNEVEELKFKRDRRYKMLLSIITILVISLFYNPFIGEDKDHWLLVVRLALAVAGYFLLTLLVKVIAKLESIENKNKGISSTFLGIVFTILAVVIALMPVLNNNENCMALLSILLLFIGFYAIYDGFIIMINYAIKNLRGKRSIFDFVLKVVPLIGSIIIGLAKILFL